METQKPNAPQRNAAAVKPGSNVRGIKNAFLVIIACFVVAVILFLFVFGNPSHFDAEGFEGASMWFAPEEFAKAHPLNTLVPSSRAVSSCLSSRPSSSPLSSSL